MLFMLDSAKVNGKRLLKPGTYAELFKPQAMVTASQFYPTQELTQPHWTTVRAWLVPGRLQRKDGPVSYRQP
jgi:hypothetical protein